MLLSCLFQNDTKHFTNIDSYKKNNDYTEGGTFY